MAETTDAPSEEDLDGCDLDFTVAPTSDTELPTAEEDK